MEINRKIKIAVNGGIGFGAKLNSKQLVTIAAYMDEELELTTFQQLYVEVPADKQEEIIAEFTEAGLACYPVGNFVKSLRTCNFCKGEEAEGMPVAKEMNRRIAGKPVPATLKVAYTGCAVGCGEPMLSDIGAMKNRESYNLYVGGKAKGKDAEVGSLLLENLSPEELYDTVDKIIARYAQLGKKREAFYKYSKRVGLEQLISESRFSEAMEEEQHLKKGELKMKTKKMHLLFVTTVLAFLLAACSAGEQENQHATMNHGGTEEMDHMNHSSSGKLPDGLKEAENPAFAVGSQAIMNTDHMEGMKGAEATIAGAFATTVYAISYTPTTGGEQVANHKWIIHEEIKDAKSKPYQPSDKVTVEANHMEGMEGAEATIDFAQQTTVYMVDYTSGGEQVKNHKWVTESELSEK